MFTEGLLKQEQVGHWRYTLHSSGLRAVLPLKYLLVTLMQFQGEPALVAGQFRGRFNKDNHGY